jgi:type 1 fimbria pilin
VGRRSTVGTGTTSLLMIFTVRCFATLAMLSLSTALADQRIQARGQHRAQSLAAAKGEAAAAVARFDAYLKECGVGTKDSEAYFSAVARYDAGSAEGVSVVMDNTDGVLTVFFANPVDDTSELVTVLRVNAPGAAGRYTLKEQYTRLTDGWEPEAGPGVWIPS